MSISLGDLSPSSTELWRLTRVVCGQDPRCIKIFFVYIFIFRHCIAPRSLPPFEWDPKNISKWPVIIIFFLLNI